MVVSLGQEDPLEKEMATQYSCLKTPTERSLVGPKGHKQSDKTD